MQHKSLSIEETKKIVDILNSNSINHIILSTREPLCYSDIVAFLKYCRYNKIFVTITTNGTLFTDAVFEEVYKGFIDRILISLEGLKDVTNDYIRGKGTFDKVMNTLGRIECLNNNNQNMVKPIIQINLSVQNYKEIELGLFDFLNEYKHVEIVIGNLIGYGNAKDNTSIILGFNNYKKHVFKLVKMLAGTKYKYRVGFKEMMPYEILLLNLIYDIDINFSIPQCSLFKSRAFGLLPNGNICRCNILLDTGIIDNFDLLLDDSLEKGLSEGISILPPKYHVRKRDFCTRCRWKEQCNICLLYTEAGYINSEIVNLCEKAFNAIEKIKSYILEDKIKISLKSNLLIIVSQSVIKMSDTQGNIVEFTYNKSLEKTLGMLMNSCSEYYSKLNLNIEKLEKLLYANLLKVKEVKIDEVYS